jgi:hypothetical protein
MRTSTVASCLLLVAGCSSFGGGSGAANTFYFASCGPDCSLTKYTVAAGGAHTTIAVNGMFAAVRSTEPSVATLTKNQSQIEVISGNPGTTTLQILDAAGRILAQSPLTVEATATLRPDSGVSTTPLVLEGQPLVYHVTTLNAHGDVTKGSGAVSFTLGGTLMPDILPVDGDAIGFVGSAGSGSITGSCLGASVTSTIEIVPASAITRLDLSPLTQPNEQAIVTVLVQSVMGPVYAGPCRWTTSDPSVTLASDVGPTLSLQPGTLSVFNLTRPGTFTVTCQLAGLSSSVTLTR